MSDEMRDKTLEICALFFFFLHTINYSHNFNSKYYSLNN